MMNIYQNEFHVFTSDVQKCSLPRNAFYFISEESLISTSVIIDACRIFNHVPYRLGVI